MSAGAELTPDRAQLAEFVKLLFKNARAEGYVAMRSFVDGSEDERAILTEWTRLGDPVFVDIVYERASQTAAWSKPAVFCPPVATFRTNKNAKIGNLHEGVALSVECDQHPLQARQKLEAILGDPTVVVESGGEWINPETGEIEPKVHLHWRLAKPTSKKAEHDTLREARNLATDLVGGDGTNKSIVHPIRWPGSWHRKGAPRLAKMIASSESEVDLSEAIKHLRDVAGAAGFDSGAGRPRPGKIFNSFLSSDPAAVAAALAVIPNEDLAWRDWNNFGMAIWGATGGSEVGRDAFATWSAKSTKNEPEVTEARWRHYKTSPPTNIGFGTLVYWARHYSPGWSYGPAELATDPVDLWAKFDPPTLPRGILPGVIEAFAFERGAAMGCDLGGLAVCALAVCAAAIPDSIQLQPKKHDTQWLESARLWVAPVGSPSTMKSPMMAAAAKPLRRIDNEMARDNRDAMNQWHRLQKEEQRETPQPRQPRLMMEDTTIEAAQEVLKDSSHGVLSYQDELSGWFGAMDKYSGGRGAAKDRGFWLQSFNGGSYSVNRIGRGSVFIENLSVSMLGGIQPEPIRKLAEDGSDDGLLQRLIPIVLRPAVVGRDEPASDAAFNYNDLINNLHELKPPTTGGILPAVTTLRFDDGALAIRTELEKKHLELQQCETINRKLASHIGKYNGIFARLCVVWHCVEHAKGGVPGTITETTAQRAKGFLHGFLLPHALAFYAGVLGLSNDHDRLTAVAGYILAHKLEQITNRDVQRGDRTMCNLARRETESIFEQLDALGWVTRVPAPRPTDPPHWVVNPVVHQRFAERGKAEAERRERERVIVAGLFRRNEAA